MGSKKKEVPTDKKPRVYLSTNYSSAIRAAGKIKNKYKKKTIGKKKFEKDSNSDENKKTSSDWLKSAGYLDTTDQKAINHIFVPPKKTEENNIPADAGHFIRSEIEITELKKF